ncbi:hypothetical protein XO10_03570 [Marinitoga sp. 1135]|uniref:Integral membrane protein n=1 Tax=Marinitoga piezophila (strain DSM 14283 / JCM 11233 / KA3) TaxID=443254 RepID=H2J6F7_MARPK|nr:MULTISPECIES: lysylphosphatidylglycerol synthase transmembrane domain-containing protein [Marinitoga]AEX85142.1 hypothetical protein Marpi_0704 [Marinitoga piezophila KA3]APT75642.1 hypothetical protein LN42_03970 [Marinitoga sp. 1137]NUU95350.1 hypothetical protein [Marinitoga sp. 1135]NUU97284.1 hypothetical protein [Marinitoga sp. 1138]
MKKYLYGFLFAFITSITLYILISGFTGFYENIKAFAFFNWKFLLIALLVIILKWFIESFIIKILLKDISIKHALNFTLIGQFYSYLTPFYTGGQPIQILYISRFGIDPARATAIILFKTFLFQIILASFGVFSTIYSILYLNIDVIIASIIGTLLNLLAVFLIIFYIINQNASIKTTLYFANLLKKIGLLKNPEKYIDTIIEKVKTFILIFKEEAKNFKKITLIVFLSILQFSCSFMVLPIILQGYGINISLNTISRSIITQISSSIIPTPGTAGGAEGIFLLLFKDILNIHKLNATIVLWRFSIYYFVLLIGGIVVLLNHKNSIMKKIKKPAE